MQPLFCQVVEVVATAAVFFWTFLHVQLSVHHMQRANGNRFTESKAWKKRQQLNCICVNLCMNLCSLLLTIWTLVFFDTEPMGKWWHCCPACHRIIGIWRCSLLLLLLLLILMMMTRAHSFAQAAEFWAEPRNLLFSAEFWYCCGILQKLRNDHWLVRSSAW